MRLHMLDSKVHQGYLGMVKCRSPASAAVWWPCLKEEVEEMVRNCIICSEHTVNRQEPRCLGMCSSTFLTMVHKWRIQTGRLWEAVKFGGRQKGLHLLKHQTLSVTILVCHT